MTTPTRRPGRSTLRVLAALGAAAALTALPAGLGATANAAQTCDGQTATITGTRGQALNGTDGDDVIVSNGASSVNPGDGHDLVCLTGTPGGTVTVFAVAAGQRIDASASQASVQATVGPGATYTGGPRADTVTVQSNAAQPAHVSTGGGDDSVTVGSYAAFTGAPEPTADDVVSLGSGDDQLYVDSAIGGGSLAGDAGTDTLYLAAGRPHPWTVDLGAGRVGTGGPQVPLTGMERVGGFYPWSSLTVLGSPRADRVELGDLFGGGQQGPVTLRLGGGDDTASLSRNLRGSVDGGAGRNTFDSTRSYRQHDQSLRIALRAGTLTTAGHTLRVRHVQQVAVSDSVRATVLGTNGPDKLVVNSCVTTLKGLGGNDTLRVSLPAGSACHHPPRIRDHVYGGGGNDALSGTGGHDVLIGGPGRDHADGRGGGDRCVAERTVACGPRR